jgi:Tol biopolymer transport system component
VANETETQNMFSTKRFSAVTTALLVIAALAALAMHSTAKGAKPGVVVKRPISYLTATSSFNIALIDQNGSSSITVNRDTSGSYPRWSPDGLLIGGYHKWLGNDSAIMAMSPSGANEQIVLTEGQFLAWNLSRPGVLDSSGFDFFSSNCWLGTNAIIFAGSTTYLGDAGQTLTANRLFIVDAIGGITPLTESAPHAARYDFDPHWSAALNKVVFVGVIGGTANRELYTINPDGTGAQQITAFGGSVRQLRWPVWSPAGNRVIASVRPGPSGTTWQLWIFNVDLSQPNPGVGVGGRVTAVDPIKVVDGGGGYVQTAAWSPDGQRIVFSRTVYDSRNRRFFELVIADAVSGAETVIKRSSSNIELPDWNPVP